MIKRILATILLTVSMGVAFAAEIPIDAKLDYNQGIDFYKLGMYERAIESFRSAIRTYPDYIDAYYNLATILEYLKQYAEALNIYKQVPYHYLIRLDNLLYMILLVIIVDTL